MKQSLERQKRLYALRSLQADFAAAEVRRSQMEADETAALLQQARHMALSRHEAGTGQAADPHEWVLRCAEQELAGLEVDRQSEILQQIDARTDALRDQELLARRDREQVKFMCDRMQRAATYLEQISDQARLDDLFNAARLRVSNNGATPSLF